MADVKYAAIIREYTALAALGSHRGVRLDTGGVDYASADDAAGLESAIGITTAAAEEDATARVALAGPITEPSWSWTHGRPVYFGLGGLLTQTAPTSGAIRQVGIAETSTRLLVQLSPTIKKVA